MKQKSRIIAIEVIAAGLLMLFSASLVYARDWTKEDFLANAFEKVEAISVADAQKPMKGVIFLDIRTKDEVLAGSIPGSIHLQRGFLELKISNVIPDKNKKIIIYCKGGNRSALAALTLMQMGYKNVYNLSGGYTSWIKTRHPDSQ